MVKLSCTGNLTFLGLAGDQLVSSDAPLPYSPNRDHPRIIRLGFRASYNTWATALPFPCD